MSQSELDEVSQLDDFEVVEERRRVMVALIMLTDKYKRLNAEYLKAATVAPESRSARVPLAPTSS